ncbi:MAG: cupin domain-containing protein [Lentisphaerae bacterium]|nr:cupin domain-containing protein [Lentisphaerota bacterium]
MKPRLAVWGVVLCLVLPVRAEESAGITSVQLAKSSASWNGAPLPSYPAGAPEITIMRITIPPGVALPMHQHPVINAGVLLSGELTVVTERNDTLQLKAGDPIIEVVDTWHFGRNTGTNAAEILIVYAGTTNAPVTVKRSPRG